MVLINLPEGTTLRLLAMTRHGQLTSMETVFAPTEPDRLVLDVQDNRLPGDREQTDLQTYQIEVGGGTQQTKLQTYQIEVGVGAQQTKLQTYQIELLSRPNCRSTR